MDQLIPDAASVVALRLPPDDWDDVLDALGAAAEHISAYIDTTSSRLAPAPPPTGWRAIRTTGGPSPSRSTALERR
jgi:hypothetical protein